MPSHSAAFEIPTRGESEVLDLTDRVQEILEAAGFQSGICLVSIPGSTASVTTIEFESGAVQDLREALERMVHRDGAYQHDARWGDGNGFSHVRAALMGPSLALPFREGRLVLGTWQQVILVDHDNRARRRRVAVQLVGE